VARVECLGCGHVLLLPPSIPDGGEFACAHCGLSMRNVAAARGLRWRDVDPYVRRHGASRTNLWGGLAGAAVWLPILACVLASQGRLDGAFLAAIGLPYVALLAVLGLKRARTAPAVWQSWVWSGLGAYALYIGALLVAKPGWVPLFSGTSGLAPAAGTFLGFGAAGLMAGAIGVLLHRRRMRTLPRVSREPPALR
jgi:hypothetical protein